MDKEPAPAGDDCIICWGEGKTFGDRPTPSKVDVLLFNIEKNPLQGDPDIKEPNGWWTLTQTDPCVWEYDWAPWWIRWIILADQTLLSVICAGVAPAFAGVSDEICHTVFKSVLEENDWWFFGGSGIILCPGVPHTLAYDYNLVPQDETRMHACAGTDDAVTIRFANRNDHTNIIVRYDETP